MISNPSVNPADTGTLAGTLQFAMKRMLQGTNGMLPAKIIAYDRDTNRANVQILITLITTDGKQVPRAQLASVPVMIIGGGGYMLSFPLKTGDLGWIVANDRDISLFLQSYAQSPPNTERINNFSDGVFLPDAMTNYTIDAEDDEHVVLQSLDGLTKISVGDSGVTIKSPLRVDIDCPLVTVNPTLPGLFAVNGAITASGAITPGTPVPP